MAALGLTQLLLAGLVLALAAVTLWSVWQLRRPRRWTYSVAMARGEPGDPAELDTPRHFREFSFTDPSTRLELPAWEIAGDDPTGPTAILTPGWSESRVVALLRVPALASVCSRVVAWDPPGHGEAPGRCALGTREPRALRALIERVSDEASGSVALYGWSMGAGVSIATAAEEQSAGRVLCVIAEAPYRRLFAPTRNIAKSWGLPYFPNGLFALWLLGARFGAGPSWRALDRATLAGRVQAPVLVLHGQADEVCPVDDGLAIAQSAPRGLFISVAGAGHFNLWTEADFAAQATAAVRDFIRAARVKTGAQRETGVTDSPVSSGG